jgi:putative two-component system response regulator
MESSKCLNKVMEPKTLDKILFVDDEPSVLEAIQRSLKKRFDIYTANSAEAGLSLIEKCGAFPVVVSDYQMPVCDGVAFLARVGKISPDSIRIMLTGNAHVDTSIRAVNEGNVFRFLSKPCPMDILEKTLLESLHQHRLIKTEREYYALKKWNEGLGGLIHAFIRLIESKDPYTAGHQLRVSKISVAIAQTLNFSEESIEQIRMAASIHDIGKIYVPVEFLNKPGRLNPSEWDIVRMHAQIGHDILQPVGFPFPIHDIILQHHERIDGSGYPRGIRESDICVEAKIIAVADVVEAVSHHRPYRPAKGPEELIGELRSNGGMKYDQNICEIALSLLTSKRLQFEESTDLISGAPSLLAGENNND